MVWSLESPIFQRFLFLTGGAFIAFLLCIVLFKSRKFAQEYAGLLYNMGFLAPEQRTSRLPARKAAWILFFVGILLSGWSGWYYYDKGRLAPIEDANNPYKAQKGAGILRNPYGTHTPGKAPSLPPGLGGSGGSGGSGGFGGATPAPGAAPALPSNPTPQNTAPFPSPYRR